MDNNETKTTTPVVENTQTEPVKTKETEPVSDGGKKEPVITKEDDNKVNYVKEIAKEKLRKVNSGKKLTEETKKKIGEASKKLGLKPPSKKGMHWKLVNGKRVYYK